MLRAHAVAGLAVPVAGVAILVAGCGPNVRSASFASFSPRPRARTVQVYSSKLPTCPYEEVGLVRVSKGFGGNTLDEMLEALRLRAREMGGDAVVGLGQTQQIEGRTSLSGRVSVNTTDGLAGTVVRFTDDECRQ